MKKSGPRKDFRGDIQALRAFAVLVVAANHLFPGRLSGGFIGVDVFFVISGFLISTHLMKSTLDPARKLHLGAFYARRIRRLLPAAFTVLGVSTVGVLAFLPPDMWRQNLTEIFTSSSYVQNLYLTARAVDYHAQGQAATVAQHYWSLSVEEQFYIVWPWLLLALAWLARRGGHNARHVTAIGMAVFVAGFLAFSVWYTHADFNRAYFFTPIRVWEFATGGLVAALSTSFASSRFHRTARLLLAVAGWIAMMLSAWFFTPATFFPGYWAAVPTFGAAAVIAAGTDAKILVLDWFTSLRPVRWLGDVSYSIYLWHWPLIVLAPYVLGTTVTTKHKLGIFALTLVLAGLSKPFIEDRGIHSVWFGAKLRRAFAFMCIGIIIFALSWQLGGKLAEIRMQTSASELQRSIAQGCAGPAALDPKNGCDTLFDKPISTVLGPDTDYSSPPPGAVKIDMGFTTNKFAGQTMLDFRKNESAPVKSEDLIVLVGDSHSDQWKWPMYQIAKANHKRLEIMINSGCSVFTPQDKAAQDEYDDVSKAQCGTSNKVISDYIKKAKPSILVYSSYAKDEWLPGPGSQQDNWNNLVGTTFKGWLEAGVGRIYVIADVPYNMGVRDIFCYSIARNPARECRVDRVQALGTDPLPGVAASVNSEKVKLLDFTDAFCDRDYCYAVAGGMPVYFDTTHINRQYSLLLVPRLADGLGLKVPAVTPKS